MRTIDLWLELRGIEGTLVQIETALEDTTKAISEKLKDQTSYLSRIDMELALLRNSIDSLGLVRNSIERCKDILRNT